MDVQNATPHHQIRKERNFPSLDLTTPTNVEANTNQPILIIQSPKTPTLSRKLKAISLDSDKPEAAVRLSRDVASVPCTPKRNLKPKQSLDLEDKLLAAPGTNLRRFASNTSISGSQTLKTLPEVTALQDFTEVKPVGEPPTVKMKAKGLLERRGSNASLTIDLGSNSSLSDGRFARLNNTKSASHVNLTSLSSDKCSCTFETTLPSRRTGSCRNRCYTFHKKCNCLCNFKCRRKSLSNENLYVPPCAFCSERLQKDSGKNYRSCKGCRRAVYPRQPELEASHVLSDDFKLHLQNVQYLQTAGNVLSVEELQRALEPSRVPKLHQEFWEVPLNLQEKCLVSGSQSKNRYKGVLPNEHSRVHLTESQNYIHANYIKGPDYSETSYIATQGPMDHTCADFWEMVWTSECKCIVMLTNLIERGKTKCTLYFPLGKSTPSVDKSYLRLKTVKPLEKFSFGLRNAAKLEDEEETVTIFEELNEVEFDVYKITFCAKRQMGDGCEIRELEVTRRHDRRRHLVFHYWFANWQDHKMANPDQVLSTALHLLEASKKPEDKNNSSLNSAAKSAGRRLRTSNDSIILPCVVAHCSAGIGRTGCFLAILNGIRQLRASATVDVLAILCSLRLNRGGMVQTAEQYELIYRVLNLYAQTLE